MRNIAKLVKQIISSILFIIFFSSLTAETLSPSQEARCLSCIRNVTNILGVDVGKRCEGYYCGHYQLSYTYWAEAGKPGNNQGLRDYEKCARDKECSERAVKAYFKKYKRDCNNDGLVDCLDMAALHKGGPISCSADWFYKSRFWNAFNKTMCMLNRDIEGSKLNEDDGKDMDSLPQRVLKNQTLTQECLDCICDATSGCNISVNNCGSGTVCGPFAISQAYWKDGRRPGTSWTACTRTKECAGVTVKNYMEKYKKDCNGDGVITCEDYAAIHRRGPNFCMNRDLLKEHYWNKFLSCRANQKPSRDVNLVKVGDTNDEQSGLNSRVEVSSVTTPSSTTSLPTRTYESTSKSTQSPAPISMSHDDDIVPPVTSPRPSRPYKAPTYELASIKFDTSESSPSSTRGYSYQVQATSTTKLLEPKPASITPQAQQVIDLNPSKFDYSHSERKQVSETTPYQSYTTTLKDYRETTTRRDSGDHVQLPIIVVSKPLGPLRSPNIPIYTTSLMTSTTSTTRQPTTFTATSPISTMLRSSSVDNRATTRLQVPTVTDEIHNSSPAMTSHTVTSTTQTERPIIAPANVEESDYLTNEYPYHPNTADRTSNFDKVVIGIVGNPDFTKSYPPLPEILTHDSQDYNLTDNSKDQAAEKSHQRVNTSHPKVYGPSTNTRLASAHETQLLHMTEKTTVKIYPSDSTTLPVKQPSEFSSSVQTEKNSPEPSTQQVSAVLSLDSLNMTGISDYKGLNESNRIPVDCLECICDASSNCDTSVQCISKQREKNRCGMYMISWNQFQESDISLTSLATVPPGLTEDAAEERLYYECSTDKICAEKLIHLYIEKYQRDCNNDGKIDCYDIAAIHRVGPENCNSSKFLSSQYWRDFKNCHTAESSTTTVQPSV